VQWAHRQSGTRPTAKTTTLLQRYRDGVPDSVIVLNNAEEPVCAHGRRLGLYSRILVDAKAPHRQSGIRRVLTTRPRRPSGGRRGGPQGRSVPESFRRSPNSEREEFRRGLARYDLTGDAKTAVKGQREHVQPRTSPPISRTGKNARWKSDTRNWSAAISQATRMFGRASGPQQSGIAQDKENRTEQKLNSVWRPHSARMRSQYQAPLRTASTARAIVRS